jgi:hypothetical protein
MVRQIVLVVLLLGIQWLAATALACPPHLEDICSA